jgi:hypothetical protein
MAYNTQNYWVFGLRVLEHRTMDKVRIPSKSKHICMFKSPKLERLAKLNNSVRTSQEALGLH